MSLKRKTEVYKVLIQQRQSTVGSDTYHLEELKDKIIMEDFLEYYYMNYLHSETNDKKVILKSRSICYYIDSVEKTGSTRKVLLKYIKFNKNAKVVNITTFNVKYKKSKEDGDEERQHYIIKTYNSTNRAVIIYEKISSSITIGMLEDHINKAYREWVKSKYTDDEKKYLLGYEIRILIVPSPDFVEELTNMDKISLLKVSVLKEKLTSDEDILYSEDHISRDCVDLLYKPHQGLSFSKSKIINYFNMYNNGTTKNAVKRIVISGRKDGNGISIDTEQMKLSKFIELELDTDGMVDSNSIFEKYTEMVNDNFREYFNDIFIDIDESEE